MGAIGKSDKYSVEIEAETPSAAKVKLYESYEHIENVSIWLAGTKGWVLVVCFNFFEI